MENYTLTKLIGQGAYGKVYTAQHKATGKVAAVKEVDDCQAGESEAAIMAVLKDCPSAVHLRDAGEASPADNGQSRFFIVMDLCQGGDLGSFVEVGIRSQRAADKRFGCCVHETEHLRFVCAHRITVRSLPNRWSPWQERSCRS